MILPFDYIGYKHLSENKRLPMLVKSLIIPNVTYVASVTNIDKEYVSKFKTMIYKFIWNDKREKVKRETMEVAWYFSVFVYGYP
jgi:hypothetical protein